MEGLDYMLEQSKNTVVPMSVQAHARSCFKLHVFSDASTLGLCAAIYVVEYINTKPILQHLHAAKPRIAPKGQSIPRLELTDALMLAELQSNILVSLENHPIKSCHYWVDSTTVLYWLVTKGPWTCYVRNRVKWIEALSNGDWKYVSTKENPSDLGTRGVKAERLKRFWYEGRSWLGNEKDWSTQPILIGTRDTQVETIKVKEKVKVTIATMDDNRSHFITNMTSGFTYRKLLRITG